MRDSIAASAREQLLRAPSVSIALACAPVTVPRTVRIAHSPTRFAIATARRAEPIR
jgi:hypothetical protein